MGKRKIFILDQGNTGIYGETIKRQKKQHKQKIHDVFITTYYQGDHITDNKTGRACFMHGREEKCIQSLGKET